MRIKSHKPPFLHFQPDTAEKGKFMMEHEKKLLQAKHRLEEAQARDRVKERKARTRRLIQERGDFRESFAAGAEDDFGAAGGFSMGSIQISSMSWGAFRETGASLFSRGAHLLTTPKGRWYFLRKSCALRGGLQRLRTPLGKAAFLPNCQPCPCSRRRGFQNRTPCSMGVVHCHPIPPPACVNLPPAA